MVQSAADSYEWDKYITDTHNPCGTVCSELSRMGQVHHRHTQPMWYSPQRTLTHGTSTSQSHTAMWYSPQRTLTHGTSTSQSHTAMWYSPQRTLTRGTSTSQTHTAHVVQSAADSHTWDKYITVTHSHVVQSAADSHAWDKYITDTHSPCGTVHSRLSPMGQVHHRQTQPMWYSPQRTLTHGTSTSQTHTAHVVQSAADSHAWDKYITDTHSPCGTIRSGLSRMGQVHPRHTQPMWYSPQWTLMHGTSTSQTHTAHVVQSAADSHTWDKYITDTHSPCGTVRSGLSRMGQVHPRHTQPMWYSPQWTLTHGTSTSQTHTAHVVQSAANSHAWDKYITDTHSPCGTVRSGLSRMGQVHHRHIQPMWYSPQRTLTHRTSTSQTHTAHVVQSAADSHAWDKYMTVTHSPCGTVHSGLSRMGQVHHRHTQPMWYSPQRTLTHETSTSQTHTAHVVQSAANSHAWDKYITDTHSPCGTVRSGLSRMGQVHDSHTQPMWYSPQRTLTHGTSTSQTHTAHVVQSAADSHAWDKYMTVTHSPCGTVRSGLSHMGQVHHRHTQPMWYSPQRTLTHGTSTSQTHTAHVVQSAADSHAWDKYMTVTHSPCGTVRSGLSHMGQVHHRHTQPMWYSPQRTLTHGTSTSQTHTAHVVQSAADSHAWDKYMTVTHSPCGTVRSGLSHMGQVHHRHTQPMWYSPQRTLTHGTSTSQSHTAHVVQSAADSHAWDKYMTVTHSPCGTVRSGLSRMGQVHHRHTQPMWYSPQRTLTHGTSTSQTHSPCGTVCSGLSRMGQVHDSHTQPMWYSPQRTLTHGTSTSQTHTAHVVQSAADSHAWDKYITDTHSPCGTVRSGLSRMGQVHHRHTQPMWYTPQRTLTHGTSTSQTHTAHVVQSAVDSHAWGKYITDTHYNIYNINLHHH